VSTIAAIEPIMPISLPRRPWIAAAVVPLVMQRRDAGELAGQTRRRAQNFHRVADVQLGELEFLDGEPARASRELFRQAQLADVLQQPR